MTPQRAQEVFQRNAQLVQEHYFEKRLWSQQEEERCIYGQGSQDAGSEVVGQRRIL